MRIAHDAFRWRGIGKTGAEVWHVLDVRGRLTVQEIAAATGRHRRTVMRKLGLLRELHMAVELDGGEWTLVDDADLDALAEELGTVGTGDRQRRKHARQRMIHQSELERRNSRRN